MCIIAYIPVNKDVSIKSIETMFKNNPDGAGILYIQNKKIRVFKTFEVNQLISKYNSIKANINTDIVIHCRIGTHGLKSFDNIHPFIVNKNLGFVHNGIISDMPIDKKHSDTYMFNELILKQLPADFISNEAIKELISGYIGSSKLVFMDYNQNITIINEHKGLWDNGIWFSNYTYQDYEPIFKPYKNKKSREANKSNSIFKFNDDKCPNCNSDDIENGYCWTCDLFFEDMYSKELDFYNNYDDKKYLY